MNIFVVEGGIVLPTEEAKCIYPFRDIWERDTTVKKDIATKEFAYIEFMCSYKKSNPFAGYAEELRPKYIIDRVVRIDGWQPDDLIKDGILTYKHFQTEASPSIKFYEAALKGVSTMQSYYETLDMTKVTKNGALVNKPSDVARGLSQTAAVLQNLETLKDKVQQELFESNRIRANRTVNQFER